MTPPPLLRVCRPVLAPTAAADVLAGAACVGGLALHAGPVALATAGSVALYSAGMVQNDVCDRGIDQKKAPGRPLVTNPALVRSARVLAAGLYLAGLVAAAAAGVLVPALIVFVLANAYNLGFKRVFVLDAATLGGARAANLWMGLAVGSGSVQPRTAMLLGAYGLYVAALSAASRAEDLEPEPTRALALFLSFFPTTLAYAALIWFVPGPRGWALLAPWLLHAVALGTAMRGATKPAAKRFVFFSLLLILAIHGAWLWGLRATAGVIAVLCCAAATFVLRGALTSRPGTPAVPSGSAPSAGPGTSSAGS